MNYYGVFMAIIEDITNKRDGFATWLERAFLKYQASEGKRLTLDEFANRLGVSRPLLSQYLSGDKTPGVRRLARIAEVLGPEAYDAMGISRPPVRYADPLQQLANDMWDSLTEEEKAAIDAIVEGAILRQQQERGEPLPDEAGRA